MTANDHADWKDACLFKCQVCWKLETTSRPDFLEHLLLIHSMVGSQYEVTELAIRKIQLRRFSSHS